ncbi:MAG TPA: hypothetical protein VK485_11220 [Sphingomicrobium sp.]|nr:hypothetical protein [Sphingomicrobium sp.]
MTGYRPFTLLAAIIFGLMALVHIYRIVTHFQVIVGSHAFPQSVSWIALFVAGALSIMLFREAKR